MPLDLTSSIEEQLARKIIRRQEDHVPYPAEISPKAKPFDGWDHMFLNQSGYLYNGLTLINYDPPPRRVIDIGCGFGHWLITAAHQWPEAELVGLDIHDIHPNLDESSFFAHMRDRVEWVQVNMLNGVPFPPQSFDLVHVSRIALGVPEDEWQFLIMDFWRILKFGGFLEIMEEDLIFPCGPYRQPFSMRREPSMPELSKQPPRPEPQQETPPTPPTPVINTDFSSSLSTFISQVCSSPTRSKVSRESSVATVSSSSSSSTSSLPRPPALGLPLHPQDHSRLERSWENMLSDQFICGSVLSILPLYIQTVFEDVQMFPHWKVLLPSNSKGVLAQVSQALQVREEEGYRLRNNTPSVPSSSGSTSLAGDLMLQKWAPMHLARVVNQIQECKASMETYYNKLYSGHPLYRPRPVVEDPHDSVPWLTDFETCWRNWEGDMIDRIGMHGSTSYALSVDVPSEAPASKAWAAQITGVDYWSTLQPQDPRALCRSIRGFACRKTEKEM